MSPLRAGNIKNGNNSLALAAVGLWGGSCVPAAKQMICYNVDTPNGRPMTVGDYLLYPGSQGDLTQELEEEANIRADMRARGIDASTYGPDLLEHEARHSDQWQHFNPAAFLTLYFAGTALSYLITGTDGDANPWEIGANPYKGRYWEYDEPLYPPWLKPLGHCLIGLCW
jgi:hypothetical protein